MKKIFAAALVGLFLLGFIQVGLAQKFSGVDKSPLDMAYYPPRAATRGFAKTDQERKAAEPVVRVIYSRPMKKGRDIFGGLETYGTMWRLGANESTEILFFKDVMIGGQKVKAGRYTMYAELGEREWKVFINSDTDGWGAYHYNPDHNVASVTVPVEIVEDPIDAFSIVFEKANKGAYLIMGWDDTVVRVLIEF